MNFGEVLSRAWGIIWKNKILWVFGFLASLAGGGNGNLQTNYRFQDNDLSSRGLEQFFSNLPAWVPVLAALVGLVIFIVFILLATIGRAGLVRGAWLADEGESKLTFSRLFTEGQTYFGRVLLLGILVFALGLAVLLLVVLPTVLATAVTMGLALICILPLICLLIPAFLMAGVIVDMAIIAIVGENLSVMDALRRAWEVLRAHLGEIIGLALILIIANAVAGFVIGLPMLVVMLPMIGALVNQSELAFNGGMLASLLLFLAYLPILLALRAVIQAYVDTTWTVAFRRMTGRAASTGSASVDGAPAAV